MRFGCAMTYHTDRLIRWESEEVQFRRNGFHFGPGVLSVLAVVLAWNQVHRHEQSLKDRQDELARDLWEFHARGATFRTAHRRLENVAGCFPILHQPARLKEISLADFHVNSGERLGHEPKAFQLRFIVDGGLYPGARELLAQDLRRFKLVERRNRQTLHGLTVHPGFSGSKCAEN